MATDGVDLAAVREEFTYLPSRPMELKCANITTFSDSLYEGTEVRGINLFNSDVTLRPGRTVLEILDNNSE